ncbi:MAG: ribbon-helix-helix protein, CopG family [Actinobacteria bacterium]|nr:ribbon-helix-helix protein, CopG family [Cyanobacteriota bacterium]MCL5771031.1 ribbon-helix-helix protein, CopG family [Actinomycetota bacterium]
MKRTQIYIDENIYSDIEKEAKHERRTVSDLIREMLSRELRIRNREKSVKSAEILIKLINLAAEGPADLSVKGEDYLIEELTK